MKLFGTFSGVFVPSYEAILGAVLFLILPMLTGAMGFQNMMLIVLLANTATIATAFSISDCTTNLHRIGPGGMYAVAKRSLGLAFGGSIGIQLFIAQAASIGFYSIGFADPLQKFLAQLPLFAGLVEQFGFSVLVQKQIIGTLIATTAFIAGLVGADFIVKIQMVIFIILSVSIGSIIVSPLLVPLLGLPGGERALFLKVPNMIGTGFSLGFWGAFAAFFPAVTGIDAGVGMSGNLKDPRKSLGKGTFTAIGITFLIYIVITYVFSLINPSQLVEVDGQVPTAIDIFSRVPVIPWILLAGILFATGSSALSYFMTAPRTAQALARDNTLPRFLSFLGKDFRKGGAEPRWATVLTFLIVIPVIWAGDVTFASLIVGISFLVVYGWVNLAAFLERISGNPSFRPTSKGHWSISLYGFMITMVVISMFNPLVGVIVFTSQIGIFLLLLKYKSNNRLEGVWWGVLFSLITHAFRGMKTIIQGTKNWRPIMGVFVFGDRETESQKALEIAGRISSYKGITMVNVIKPEKKDAEAFPVPESASLIEVEGDHFDAAVSSIIQSAVPGGLSMNTVLLPIDPRVDLTDLIEKIISLGRNVLLYKDGDVPEQPKAQIDVWWKGEVNGNLMALLSYIIVQSDREAGQPDRKIRMIRRLARDEDPIQARKEMEILMTGARLRGEVVILPDDKRSIQDTILEISSETSLILIGMPGKPAPGIAKIFSLDRLFFSRELGKYKNFPPILFVKAARTMDLIE
jgi:amino acid transporter